MVSTALAVEQQLILEAAVVTSAKFSLQPLLKSFSLVLIERTPNHTFGPTKTLVVNMWYRLKLIFKNRCYFLEMFWFLLFFQACAPNTFFLFLCLDLVESCPIPPFPRAPDGVFPRCCCPADAGGVGVGGGVFSGESRLVFTLADCPKRCGYKSKMSNSHYIIKSHTKKS